VRKVIKMPLRSNFALGATVALSLGLGLAGCGDLPNNTSVYSVKQPVVARSDYTLDVNAGAGGLPVPDQQQLAEWFETLNLRYGDRVAIDGALPNDAVREDVSSIAARHGLLLSEGAPLTEGFVEPGKVRVVVTRSRAYVPDCPDWTDQSDATLDNSTADGYGCAVNSNIAAMVANPQHLLRGEDGTGETVIMTSNKAIESYRSTEPSGEGGLPAVSSQEGN
jgi:pilus assembly protein CpaD